MLALAACGSNEAPYKQGTHLLYYPDANVYLDQDSKRYLLFDTVEQRWTPQRELTNEQQAALGSAVVLQKPSDPVYKDNAQHRLVYGSARYTNPSDLARKRREDSLASVPPQPQAVPAPADTPAEEAQKKKSRVGRWLQKIFGKKKEN
ncbi:MAG: hypothetical protein EOO11_18815 [Chitinophagaceae bacterium]|nr:MAG: hypothetical protein EOO11_18815 [Chitinophagaceae bacterium]